ncbi:MAG: NUDIX domain-containing protein [Nanoarchaeota archaeon]
MGKKPNIDWNKIKKGVFLVVSLGIIFDTKKRRILIARRESDPYLKKLRWGFPGGRPKYGKDLERDLERVLKERTGLKVKNLGAVFSRVLEENKKILLIYYLCEVIGGKEKPDSDFVELKWVKPQDLQKHFTTSFDKRLKEYILNLK